MTHWLLVLLIVVCVIAFLVTMVLLSSIHIRVSFTQSGGAVEGVVTVRALYGMVRIRRKLEELNVKTTGEGISVEAVGASQNQHPGSSQGMGNKDDSTGTSEATKSTLTATEVFSYVKRLPEYFRTFSELWPIARHVMHRVRVPVLRVSMRVGLGDPVVTGYAVGVAWAALGTAIGGLSSLVVLTEPPEVNVEADFKEIKFETEARCIGRIKLGYAILGVLHMLRVWSRVRGTHDEPTSPRSEEEETWSTPSRG